MIPLVKNSPEKAIAFSGLLYCHRFFRYRAGVSPALSYRIRTASRCAIRQSSAALNACSCVIAFSVRFRQSRMHYSTGFFCDPYQILSESLQIMQKKEL